MEQFPEISFVIFLGNFRKKNSAEKFRKNSRNYFIKHRKKSQFFGSIRSHTVTLTLTFTIFIVFVFIIFSFPSIIILCLKI